MVFHLTLSHEVKLKASGDLKKVTAFTALYLRQYLTNGFELRDYNNKILEIGCAKMRYRIS